MKENIDHIPKKIKNILNKTIEICLDCPFKIHPCPEGCSKEVESTDELIKFESPEKCNPFLTEEDCNEAVEVACVTDPPYSTRNKYFIEGFNAAAEKANKRIEELGKEIADAKFWADEQSKGLNHYADEMSSLRAELSKANNTILIMTEDRDQFAIEFGDWLNNNFVWISPFDGNDGYWTIPMPTRANEHWTTEQLLQQFKATRK